VPGAAGKHEQIVEIVGEVNNVALHKRNIDMLPRFKNKLNDGNPASFDHLPVTLQGMATAVKETTSQRGNDYTTFKLQDGGDSVSIFTWGHPPLGNGDRVQVEGVFEREHHQGRYTFYNEVEATKVTPLH
jgi:hypothetical protein